MRSGATPAIDTGRRVLVAPLDVGLARRNGEAGNGSLAILGRAGEPATLFLRFSVHLAPEAKLLEAYVVLDRDTSVDVDPSPVALHAARVVFPWDGRSLTWSTQPSVEEFGAPTTRVFAYAGSQVRIDVRDLVERWRKRAHDELGVAIVADGQSATGVAFALAPLDVASDRDDPTRAPADALAQPLSPFDSRVASPAVVGDPRRQLGGPRLEIYLK